jgi:hypothetical protein
VGARFERHVGGSAAGRFASDLKGLDFGVGAAELPVPTLADDAATADQHASHHGIRLDAALASPSEFEGARHVTAIVVGSHRRQGVQIADFVLPAG